MNYSLTLSKPLNAYYGGVAESGMIRGYRRCCYILVSLTLTSQPPLLALESQIVQEIGTSEYNHQNHVDRGDFCPFRCRYLILFHFCISAAYSSKQQKMKRCKSEFEECRTRYRYKWIWSPELIRSWRFRYSCLIVPFLRFCCVLFKTAKNDTESEWILGTNDHISLIISFTEWMEFWKSHFSSVKV